MAKISFTTPEIQILKRANGLGHPDGWYFDQLAPIKRKIKNHKRAELLEICCYCQRDTADEHNLVLDIEHIIPTSFIFRHMFTMKNLSIACKRCNMKIKGSDTSFLTTQNLPRRPFKSSFYKFVHPNLDKIEAHIERLVIQKGRARIVKYSLPFNSDKGRFTYNYFRLKEFELQAANASQGLKTHHIKNKKVEEAFKKLTQ